MVLTGVGADEFTLKLRERQMYWTTGSAGTVERANFDGRQKQTVLRKVEYRGGLATDSKNRYSIIDRIVLFLKYVCNYLYSVHTHITLTLTLTLTYALKDSIS